MTNAKGKTNATTGVSKPAPAASRPKATTTRTNHTTGRSRVQTSVERPLRGDEAVLRSATSEPVRSDHISVPRKLGDLPTVEQPARRAVPPLSRLRSERATTSIHRSKRFNRRRYINASVVIGITAIGLVFAAVILQRIDLPLIFGTGFLCGMFAYVG